jgi:hypothetical protein
MSVLSKSAIAAKIASLFADNTTNDISEADLREVTGDIKDSFVSVPDALSAASALSGTETLTVKQTTEKSVTARQVKEYAVRVVTNDQTGTSYTLALTDALKKVDLDNSSSIALTVPPNSSVAFTVGDQILIRQKGTGQVTIGAGAGVTINCFNSRTKTAGRYAMATLIYEGADVWSLEGNLTT